jgi:hypothetical protein
MEKLKSEIFDLIAEQDRLKIQYNKIEMIKQNKLKELKEIEEIGRASCRERV